MHFLEQHYNKTIKNDLINKFYFKNEQKIPKLKKIVLNIGHKKSEISELAISSFFLELITNNKSCKLTASSKTNAFLKLRKGYPVGCKIILKKTEMYNFLFRLLNEIFPKIKDFEHTLFKSNIEQNSITYNLNNLLIFPEVEDYFSIFSNKLSSLSITLVATTKTKEEIQFLLNSFKIPIKS
jgi:large subunit ribosomal protein L5